MDKPDPQLSSDTNLRKVISPTCLLYPENCEYRGEGNCSIVIRLKKEGKVLKIIKDEINDEASNAQLSFGTLTTVLEYLNLQQEHYAKVMGVLLGSPFVDIPVVVPLSKSDVIVLNKVTKYQRPAYRLHKTVKEADTYGILLPDYCTLPPSLRSLPTTGPVLSVEIKPKQCFLSPGDDLPLGQSLRAEVCRFCMMQHFKNKKNVISSYSQFCPIDLFSGCNLKMSFALRQLIKTPQNNFKIFKDQTIVHSEETQGKLDEVLESIFGPDNPENLEEQLITLIIKALVKPFPSNYWGKQTAPNHQPQHCHNSSSPVCAIHSTCHLPKNCILKRLWDIQQLLMESADHVIQLINCLLDTSSEEYEKSSHLQGPFPKAKIPDFLGYTFRQDEENNVTFCTRKIWEFLISLSFKDCSLLLVFQQLSEAAVSIPDHQIVWGANGQPYTFSIALADLDVKPITKVEKVLNDTWGMIAAYIKDTSANKPPDYLL